MIITYPIFFLRLALTWLANFLKKGLIDELGGLDTALARLLKDAGLPENTPLVEMPPPRRETAPLPTTLAYLEYARSNLDQLQEGKALLAGPLYFYQPRGK